jgi:hypothetical protein
MIHPIVIAKGARVVKKLVRDRLVSFSPFPRSLAPFSAIRAPFGRSFVDPYPWHRKKRARSSGREQPEARPSQNLRSTPTAQLEHRQAEPLRRRPGRAAGPQAERLPKRRPGRATEPRAARSRGRSVRPLTVA